MLACLAASNSSSFTSSNCSCIWRSCVKTLTTLSPFMASSAKPSARPMACCWARKYLADLPPTWRVNQPMKATMNSTMPVSGSEYQTMMPTREIIEMVMVSRLGSATPMSWRRASTSLV